MKLTKRKKLYSKQNYILRLLNRFAIRYARFIKMNIISKMLQQQQKLYTAKVHVIQAHLNI